MWQFWIDVGGTFTDCLGLPPSSSSSGELRRCKILSTGVLQGRPGDGSHARRLVDPGRRGDPPGMWDGCAVAALDARGRECGRAAVARFEAGQGAFELKSDIDMSLARGYLLETGQEAPLLAMRLLLGLRLDQPLPPAAVRLGTTRGTNALLTRRGARCALLTTRHLGDVLRIGSQARPHLFELCIRRPPPLYESVVEADERMAADGQVLEPLDVARLAAELESLRREGVESLAVCFLNAYANPEHERAAAAAAREAGFESVHMSHAASPLPRLVSRGQTAVLDAYLDPVLRRYVERLRADLGDSELLLMTSAGGLVEADRFTGKDSLLSGPAGGVVGLARAAAAAGVGRVFGFDMGGTSTDVSRYDGSFELQYESEKAGVAIAAPTLAIETVAAGGGSLCQFDGVKLTVGPDSAGADPGPACYGRGGPLTLTDVNFFLGRLPLPETGCSTFPFPLDMSASAARLEALRRRVPTGQGGRRLSLRELAAGFLEIANDSMAQAVRTISIARGYDPQEYALAPFGGAAPQHACRVAEELGMHSVLCHPDAGLLSAVGIGQADIVRYRSAACESLWPERNEGELRLVNRRAEETLDSLAAAATRDVQSHGLPPERIHVRRLADVRYQGLDSALTLPWPDDQDLGVAYRREHQRLYGFLQDRPIEISALRAEAVGRRIDAPSAAAAPPRRPPLALDAFPQQTLWQAAPAAERAGEGGRRSNVIGAAAPVLTRSRLQPGDAFAGPAIVADAASTTVVDSGWQAEVLGGGELLLTRLAGPAAASPPPPPDAAGLADPPPPPDPSIPALSIPALSIPEKASLPPDPIAGKAALDADPIQLELFNNQFSAIAEQMGVALRRTSSSVNVKERLDYSCALFNGCGELVVNAPHIPVHLGAMSETVKCVLADNPRMAPGDVWASNDPFRGGSHLPDVTVVAPVFASELSAAEVSAAEVLAAEVSHAAPLFFVAARAHHAEIGGLTPGSMPPFSRTLADEGVLIRNLKLFDRGEPRLEELRTLLASGPWPSRRPQENMADMAAQIAACRQGARDMLELCRRRGVDRVAAYMRHVQFAAAEKVRQALRRQGNWRRRRVDYLDDGSPIAAELIVQDGRIEIDFAGTGPVLASNLNANRAIVTAAVMYCLRCLLEEDIPLNEGVLAPLTLRLPECLLNPPAEADPRRAAAMVGGNVETSQRVVDVLLCALELAAGSQGTMNNLTFGDESFGYYETICGGAGATPLCDGADAVHTHMTNTRLTDPEILEQRHPVRLLEFSIRRGSGGAGARRGGDGVVRRLLFLKELDVSLLTQRRGAYPPPGMAGGAPGAIGRNLLRRRASSDGGRDGQTETLPAAAHFRAAPGDQLQIETPGGGAWGPVGGD